MGANTFNIMRSGTGIQGGRRGQQKKAGPSIRFREAMGFKEQYNFPALVSVSALGSMGAVVKHENEETNPNITVYGADENYLKVSGYEINYGRNVTASEAEFGANVAILGTAVI